MLLPARGDGSGHGELGVRQLPGLHRVGHGEPSGPGRLGSGRTPMLLPDRPRRRRRDTSAHNGNDAADHARKGTNVPTRGEPRGSPPLDSADRVFHTWRAPPEDFQGALVVVSQNLRCSSAPRRARRGPRNYLALPPCIFRSHFLNCGFMNNRGTVAPTLTRMRQADVRGGILTTSA